MWYRILADGVVVVHLLFIAFVLLGGLLVLRWRYSIVLHIPAVLWAAWVEYQGWICPLTPVENWFRQKAGMGGIPKKALSISTLFLFFIRAPSIESGKWYWAP